LALKQIYSKFCWLIAISHTKHTEGCLFLGWMNKTLYL